MRKFYESWIVLDSNSAVATAELPEPKSAVMTADLQDAFHHDTRLPNSFVNTISDPISARKAVMMFKDECLLDFINVEEIGERDFADIDEKVVEKEIIHNVKNFIMTFGRDFALYNTHYTISRQKLAINAIKKTGSP